MQKAIPSTQADDELYNHNMTGWFIYAPNSRNAQIATYLGIPYVYCVGQYPGKTVNPQIVFIQPSRSIDPRNGKVEYLVVKNFEDICNIVDIMRRGLSKVERRSVVREQDEMMEQARRGTL